MQINTKQYGCAVSVATHLENFNDFATDAVNEFSPIGLEQFGAMMMDSNGEMTMGDSPMGAINNKALQIVLLMGAAVTLSI